MPSDPLDVLHNVYGFDSFIGPQRQIIDRVMSGEDALVIMPTGGGKSLCYQVPAVCMDGLAVIVSPLIALMEDQVAALRERGVRAAYLNSTVPPEHSRQIRDALFNGGLDLLYVAPERLLMEHFLGMLGRLDITLFAIDEAHCVSEWGPNFRPDYHRLKVLHERFPGVPRIALTATADPRTRQDMLHQLRMQDADVTITTFDRPNIHFRVEPKSRAKQKLVDFIHSEHDGQAGIVYCMTRKSTERTAEYLSRKGVNALPYHAGMSDAMRRSHQQEFIEEDGVVIAATIAFGMGIDKPDVRFVAHLDMPKTLEEYHQQTGRAGRDGKPADAWMAYSENDRWRLLRLIESDDPDAKFLKVQKDKLDAMVEFCETTSCRRHFLLDYFGEDAPARCGNCDNCGGASEELESSEQADSGGDPSNVTLKALRCVKETGQCRSPSYMAKVLHGSEADRIVENGDADISVHGAGRELSAPQWRKMFRKLIAEGYLKDDGGEIRLLKRGWDAIAEGSAKPNAVQTEAVAESREIPPAPPADNELYEALRQKRNDIAGRKGWNAYYVADNDTLENLAAEKPMNSDEMIKCPGMGSKRMKICGEEFLEIIRDFLDDHPDSIRRSVSDTSQPEDTEEDDYDENLFELLRQKRLEIANDRDVPAFHIAFDSHLKNIVRAKPTTREEMLDCHGMGDKRFETCGKAFLPIIRQYCEADDETEQKSRDPDGAESESVPVPDLPDGDPFGDLPELVPEETTSQPDEDPFGDVSPFGVEGLDDGSTANEEDEKTYIDFPPPRRSQKKRDVAASTETSKGSETECEEELLNLLTQRRDQLAERFDMKPYRVAWDRTLHHMAEKLPTTRGEFLEIHGTSGKQADRFGEKLMAVVREYLDA